MLQKRVTCPLVLLWESQFTRHVSALSLSCKILLLFEAHWPMKAVTLKHVLGWGRGGGLGSPLPFMICFIPFFTNGEDILNPESTIEGNIF